MNKLIKITITFIIFYFKFPDFFSTFHPAYAIERNIRLRHNTILCRDANTWISPPFYFENLQNERNPQAKCYAVFQPVVLTGLTGLHFVICFQIRSWVSLVVYICTGCASSRCFVKNWTEISIMGIWNPIKFAKNLQ